MVYEIQSAIIGAVVGSIVTVIGFIHQNKRWKFNTAIEIRTKSILSAYDYFLTAYFKINKKANTFNENTVITKEVAESIDAYLIAINKIDIWVTDENSKLLRKILAIFRKMSNEEKESLNTKDWEDFTNSSDLMKDIIKKEIHSQHLRKFIFPKKSYFFFFS